MTKTLKQRFDAKWALDPDTGCWLWTGAVDRRTGYGSIYIDSITTGYAHRVSYQLYVGPIPVGMQVNHGPCHNRTCVRPDHLYLGKHRANEKDRIRDGTAMFGENSPGAKLTAAQVAEIRERYAAGGSSQLALAREYGVSQKCISFIVNNKSWNRR